MSSVLEMLPEEGAKEVARARVYAFLASLFSRPSGARLEELQTSISEVIDAVNTLDALHEVKHATGVMTTLLRETKTEDITQNWYRLFDPSGGLLVPPTETHYTADSPSHGMTRGYEMADVAAFYEAFGVNVGEQTERPDHLVAELDFLHLIAVKCAVAIAEEDTKGLEVCQKARETFLVDHVVRWVGLFCQLLNETEGIGAFYPAAARVLLTFLQNEVLGANKCV